MHMSDELKNTGRGNLFVVFGEPDVEILDDGGPEIRVKVNGVDVFDPNTGDIRSNDTDGHRRLVHRHRLQRGELLRPPRLFPRRQRSLQEPEDRASGRDRRGRLGDALLRHLAPVRAAGRRPHRGEGHQSLRRRGDEGVQGLAAMSGTSYNGYDWRQRQQNHSCFPACNRPTRTLRRRGVRDVRRSRSSAWRVAFGGLLRAIQFPASRELSRLQGLPWPDSQALQC